MEEASNGVIKKTSRREYNMKCKCGRSMTVRKGRKGERKEYYRDCWKCRGWISHKKIKNKTKEDK